MLSFVGSQPENRSRMILRTRQSARRNHSDVSFNGDPAFLLADEPTGNLDSLMARQVMDLLEQINEMGTTILLVTHDPELARRAQRNVHLIDGQISDFRAYESRPVPTGGAGAGALA